ncbi:hypothetical protein JCGZ_00743 [Jatropha curcas]|uniref:Uncharacterized protein n=1 Tax=Jatropha curcas TaxID=180498 RepID=A0A067KRY3_JATCU|nr:hypothetical protein JCGZ_00743 [Jatropha curcas]
MAISKKLAIFSLVMLVCLLLVEDGNANFISNAAMEKNTIPGCSPRNPSACKRKEVNKYTRGCEGSQRCRTHDALLGKKDGMKSGKEGNRKINV